MINFPADAESHAPIVYTDGCCGKNGYGASAFAAHVGSRLYVGCEPLIGATTQSAELYAALMATTFLAELQELHPGVPTPKVWSDSQYVVNGMDKWMVPWSLAGWKTVTGQPVKNLGLWQTLHKGGYWQKAEWFWVKGHSGVLGNELCDGMASLGKQGVHLYSGDIIGARSFVQDELLAAVKAFMTSHGYKDSFSAVYRYDGPYDVLA